MPRPLSSFCTVCMMRAPSPLSRITPPTKSAALSACRNSMPSISGMFRSQTITSKGLSAVADDCRASSAARALPTATTRTYPIVRSMCT